MTMTARYNNGGSKPVKERVWPQYDHSTISYHPSPFSPFPPPHLPVFYLAIWCWLLITSTGSILPLDPPDMSWLGTSPTVTSLQPLLPSSTPSPLVVHCYANHFLDLLLLLQLLFLLNLHLTPFYPSVWEATSHPIQSSTTRSDHKAKRHRRGQCGQIVV